MVFQWTLKSIPSCGMERKEEMSFHLRNCFNNNKVLPLCKVLTNKPCYSVAEAFANQSSHTNEEDTSTNYEEKNRPSVFGTATETPTGCRQNTILIWWLVQNHSPHQTTPGALLSCTQNQQEAAVKAELVMTTPIGNHQTLLLSSSTEWGMWMFVIPKQSWFPIEAFKIIPQLIHLTQKNKWVWLQGFSSQMRILRFQIRVHTYFIIMCNYSSQS